MDRRTVAGTFCSALFASSAAAVIGATALPQNSPYFATMLALGLSGMSASAVGFAWLLFTRPQDRVLPPIEVDDLEPFPVVAEADEGTAQEKALRALRRARDRAVDGRRRRDEDACRQAADEFTAAFLSVNREFGLGYDISAKGGSYRALVQPLIALADRIHPLLREGHIEEAKAQVKAFSWRSG